MQVKGELRFEDSKACSVDTKKKTFRNFPRGTSFLQLKAFNINGIKQLYKFIIIF